MKLDLCYAGDFETTTDENDCRVWAFSLCNVNDFNEFVYGTSIDDFFEICQDYLHNYKIWFHNLKFDGAFIISYLLSHGYTWIKDKKDKADYTFTTLIGDMGQYYNIIVYFNVNKKTHHTNKVEFFDSYKLFPNLSVEKVAEAFNLPIRKLKIDYKKYRPVGHQLTEDEINYIRNDVEIMARALNEMFTRGLTKMTIASNAITYYRNTFYGFRKTFPKLPLNVDKDIRQSYRGGFTYVNEIWREKEVGKGLVLDVNSLYPSCMHSPYPLPYGQPVLFEGLYQFNPIYPLYVQSITCKFKLKSHKIPTIQIRNDFSFIANEYVKICQKDYITLFLTSVDLELFFEQYDVDVKSYNGGWMFMAAEGNFDKYIDHWIKQKIKAGKEGNGPLKSISKLMLNSLYGKLAAAGEAKRKIPYLHNDELCFATSEKEPCEPLYIPAACFITAYGRQRTIVTS